MFDIAEPASRRLASRAGVRLEVLTIVWMAVEAAVAIGAGLAARSVLLTAFGFDSLIELLSGAALLWRLRVEAQGASVERVERSEVLVTKVSAVLLTLLCLYVLITSAAGLLLRLKPEGSIVGLLIAAVAFIAMPVLALWKHQANRVLKSAALHGDIDATLTCAFLAVATLIGVSLSLFLHWWWADYIAALVLLLWLVPETREQIEAARQARPNTDSH